VDRGYSRGVRFLACLALVACSATAPIARPPAPAKPARVVEPFPADAPFRLPHTFEPSRYRVRIALGEKTLSGHVEIDGSGCTALTSRSRKLWLAEMASRWRWMRPLHAPIRSSAFGR
jgi:hypothetical protein